MTPLSGPPTPPHLKLTLVLTACPNPSGETGTDTGIMEAVLLTLRASSTTRYRSGLDVPTAGLTSAPVKTTVQRSIAKDVSMFGGGMESGSLGTASGNRRPVRSLSNSCPFRAAGPGCLQYPGSACRRNRREFRRRAVPGGHPSGIPPPLEMMDNTAPSPERSPHIQKIRENYPPAQAERPAAQL